MTYYSPLQDFSISFTDNWWNKYKNKLDLSYVERGLLEIKYFPYFYCLLHLWPHNNPLQQYPYGLHRHLFQAKPILGFCGGFLFAFFKVKWISLMFHTSGSDAAPCKSLYFTADFISNHLQTLAILWMLPLKTMTTSPHTKYLQILKVTFLNFFKILKENNE